MTIVPVIMAGGSGTRLWPLSRKLYPKQFIPLNGKRSLFQDTISRLSALDVAGPLFISNEEYRFIVAEQARQMVAESDPPLQQGTVILEPAGRNTAPAVTLAALQAAKLYGPETILLVLAADHSITDQQAFHESVHTAIPLARSGSLVTFGIAPSGPETGYGYIRAGGAADLGNKHFRVEEFVEKPNHERALQYVKSGLYYWNSGMFMFRADCFLEELEKFRPDILAACSLALAETTSDKDFLRVDEAAFSACPSESIDYAVMEKTDAAVVVPIDAGWNDVGSWSSLWDVNQKDCRGNAVNGDVFLQNSDNCLVRSEYRLVATLGLKDTIVVETRDAVLVAHKDNVQEVKDLVARLKSADRDEYRIHRKVYRPWGSYDSIDTGNRFQVKHIVVNPGEKISVQKHHHRAEHWIVVAGTAKTTIDGREQLVTENQSTYIPIGVVHALENPGKVPLELIEVQTGSYLGEDDIVRLEDRYGRV